MLHLQSQKGDIAQLVEQRTENPCVLGSNPSITTKKISQLANVPIGFFLLGIENQVSSIGLIKLTCYLVHSCECNLKLIWIRFSHHFAHPEG